MYICYGISNGPYSQWPFYIEESNWLWHADAGLGIAVQEKTDLLLAVTEFDPTKSSIVKITLRRKGSDELVLQLWQNSYQLYGHPELVWSGDT